MKVTIPRVYVVMNVALHDVEIDLDKIPVEVYRGGGEALEKWLMENPMVVDMAPSRSETLDVIRVTGAEVER